MTPLERQIFALAYHEAYERARRASVQFAAAGFISEPPTAALAVAVERLIIFRATATDAIAHDDDAAEVLRDEVTPLD